ncbi:calcium-binding and coiled-coil domain-containing protein 2-like [Punica granatum]|uniref:Uncharacterized protein n=2 Tax=Punica granatum TaxID=22663 RepID=A0A218X8E4_PUNGR|nr:calcium-binding and coiled-coil domain-containing protein 2-like [Punica granatum]OWM80980.1 hypothetical protein CDL15_Pgr007011 [Punica granatum]PKI45582.1 hypothetical protein CRG98_033898 [Punica granatum]
MDLPSQIDDCIKESINYSLGLPVSTQTLESKLRASEEAEKGLRDQCSLLQSKLKEKDGLVELARAEASMNAQALKKFVEENQKLAAECGNLLAQCNRWERECSLYENDREALMDFGNEADERTKDAEARVQELEEVVEQLSDELQRYKRKLDSCQDDGTAVLEENLLEPVLEMLVKKDEFASAHAFLEANIRHEECRKLLEMWNCLSPKTQKILALAAEVKSLEKEKELLRINLHTAEEEVKVLFDENNILEAENKRLLRHYRKIFGSGERSADTASSAKSHKRKSSTKVCSPVEKRIDFNNMEPARSPLSPIKCNSPDFIVQK